MKSQSPSGVSIRLMSAGIALGLAAGVGAGLLAFGPGGKSAADDASSEDLLRSKKALSTARSVTEDSFVARTHDLDAGKAEVLFRQFRESDPLLANLALIQWTRLDPSAAARAVVALEQEIPKDYPFFMRAPLAGLVFEQWALRDQDAALLHVESDQFTGNDFYKQSALTSIAKVLGIRDLEAGIDFAFSHLAQPRQWFEETFRIWAKKDRKRALAALAQLESTPKWRREAIEAIAETVASEDREAAAALLGKLNLSDPEEQRLGQRIDDAWILHSPARAYAALETDAGLLDDPERKRRAARTLFTQAHRHFQYEELSQMMALLDDPARSIAAMDDVADFDVSSRLISEVEGGDDLTPSSQEELQTEAEFLGSRWSESSPSEAMDWALSLKQADIRRKAIAGVLETWVTADPEQAWQSMVDAGMTDGEAAVDVVSSLARNNPDRAREVLELLPPGERRNAARAELVHHWGKENFAAAEVYVNSVARSGEATTGLWKSLVQARVESRLASDYKATADWVAAMADRDSRNEALIELGSQWISTDLLPALEFVNSLDASRARQTLITKVADSMIDRDPESALRWAMEINRPSKREELASRAVEAWARYDPLAATEAWERLNIPRAP